MGRETCVVALGGNAIVPHDRSGTIAEQRALTDACMTQVASELVNGSRVVLTHGNGPIVGNILLRNAAMAGKIPPMPLDVCGADSQGGIGYMIQQSLQNALAARGVARSVATIVTQVEVDENDAAFRTPTKPIGPYYGSRESAELTARGWTMRDDAGRGMRRVVPSPRPLRIVEIDVLRTMLEDGIVPICCGGGGIPVVRRQGTLVGVEAVIDKDLTSAVLAMQLRATRLILLTAVETVMRGFGTDHAEPLRSLGLAAAESLLQAGEFPPGNMGPKIRAALDFLRAGGREVVITDPQHLSAALAGATGTHIATV